MPKPTTGSLFPSCGGYNLHPRANARIATFPLLFNDDPELKCWNCGRRAENVLELRGNARHTLVGICNVCVNSSTKLVKKLVGKRLEEGTP